MKKHIDYKEVENLDNKQRGKLYRLCGIREDTSITSQDLSIGKMIEVLYGYDCDVLIESAGMQWYVTVAAHIDTQAKELIDALWEAVKIILSY